MIACVLGFEDLAKLLLKEGAYHDDALSYMSKHAIGGRMLKWLQDGENAISQASQG